MKITRDSYSGAIINQDDDGYKQAKIRKKLQKQRIKTEQESTSFKYRIDELEQRIKNLEEILYK